MPTTHSINWLKKMNSFYFYFFNIVIHFVLLGNGTSGRHPTTTNPSVRVPAAMADAIISSGGEDVTTSEVTTVLLQPENCCRVRTTNHVTYSIDSKPKHTVRGSPLWTMQKQELCSTDLPFNIMMTDKKKKTWERITLIRYTTDTYIHSK